MGISVRLMAVAFIIKECICGQYRDLYSANGQACTAVTKPTDTPVTVADIGCDHGYLGIFLCERDFLESGKVLACDLREGPLAIAATNIVNAGLSDKIETRLGDGLEKIKPGEADIITINGMGGELIYRILRNGEQVLKKAEYAVVSPQSKIPAFRYCLRRSNIHIAHEEVIYDGGKYYHIFVLDRLDEADFSLQPDFTDPGICGITFEDYAGKVRAYGVYSGELIKKKKILIDAKKMIETGTPGGYEDDTGSDVDALNGTDRSDRTADRLRDIETEIGYIDRIIS